MRTQDYYHYSNQKTGERKQGIRSEKGRSVGTHCYQSESDEKNCLKHVFSKKAKLGYQYTSIPKLVGFNNLSAVQSVKVRLRKQNLSLRSLYSLTLSGRKASSIGSGHNSMDDNPIALARYLVNLELDVGKSHEVVLQ